MSLCPLLQQSQEIRAVAQDGLGGERRLAQEVPDDPGRELRLRRQVKDPTALAAGAVDEVAGIERPQVVGPQEAAVRLRLGPRVAAEPQRTLIAQNGIARQGRLQEQIADDPRNKLFLDQIEDLPRLRAWSPHEVA